MPNVNSILTRYESECRHLIVDTPRQRSAAKHIRRVLGDVEIEDLRDKVAFYLDVRRTEEAAFSTIRRELGGVLVPALNSAHDGNIIPFVPKIKLPPQGEPRPDAMSGRQARALMSRIPEQSELGLFTMLALLTGARLEAILELTWDRVHFDERYIDLRSRSPLAKRMKGRATVPMCATMRRILKTAKCYSRTDRVIPVCSRTIQRRLAVAVAEAELPASFTPHVLRHTAITMMIRGLSKDVREGSASVYLASRTAGQKDFKTTQKTYEHLTTPELRPAVQAVERQIYLH